MKRARFGGKLDTRVSAVNTSTIADVSISNSNHAKKEKTTEKHNLIPKLPVFFRERACFFTFQRTLVQLDLHARNNISVFHESRNSEIFASALHNSFM